ncbi:type-F conjugative transfer system pilin assembly protein TrbC [Photobacterium damselae]|uniref:type-F conjugative transfer system pilin assembly protein TrbC n=1 Tax=Photobacterium damselae TaxID=38293 RepID=UPI004068C9D7
MLSRALLVLTLWAPSVFAVPSSPNPLDVFANASRYKAMAQSLKRQAMARITPNQGEKPQLEVMIFATLGMPEASLRQLLMQASKAKVPVIIRGLYQNDFRQTVTKVQSLITPTHGDSILGGIEINPTAFKTFGITQVPAFVVSPKDHCQTKAPCASSDFDVIYGNISLPNALELIVQSGRYAAIARKYQS